MLKLGEKVEVTLFTFIWVPSMAAHIGSGNPDLAANKRASLLASSEVGNLIQSFVKVPYKAYKII